MSSPWMRRGGRALARSTEVAALAVIGLLMRPTGAAAQSAVIGPEATNRSGPRFGALWVSDGVIADAKNRNVTIKPVLSLFGWQTEVSLGNNPGGPQPVSDLVLLAAGLDQGTLIPSVSWIVGVRTPSDLELGIGPNLTPVGVGLVLTAGTSYRFGKLNVPINAAFVPSKVGQRFSITTGFNTNR